MKESIIENCKIVISNNTIINNRRTYLTKYKNITVCILDNILEIQKNNNIIFQKQLSEDYFTDKGYISFNKLEDIFNEHCPND